MKTEIGIFIPSYRRVEKQKTFSFIPTELVKNTFIVVDKKDYKEYKKKYGTKTVLKCPKKGISKTRQWIIENSKYKYALMLDDDINFHIRNKKLKLRRCSQKEFIGMVVLLENWLKEGFIHVGISQRFGNNRIPEDAKEIGRMNNAYAYNCEEMIKIKEGHNIGFDSLENKYKKQLVMEDFFVTLSLLRLGYKNKITYKYSWNQNMSGGEGGCSLYRTAEMQAESAKILQIEFPRVVRVVEKKSSVIWKGIDTAKRKDVVIQWKKAFIAKRKGGISGFIK